MQQVTRMTLLASQQHHFHKALYNLTKSNAHSTTSKTSHETTKPTRIAILGGGITGLTAAFYARKRFPDATITLFESTHRLGGVIDSITAHIDNDNTSAICDTGTRTLRANAPRGIVTLDLLHALNLTPLILPVPTTSPAACTRYILSPTTHRPIPIPMPSGTSAPSSPHSPSQPNNPNPNHLLP
ncbi:Protoporphyrinogen oxidase, partial [Lasiodiplodia theobromae]